MTFLAQDADTGDVCGSTDGGAVAAQSCAGQQAEVQSSGIDAHLHSVRQKPKLVGGVSDTRPTVFCFHKKSGMENHAGFLIS